MTSLGSGLVSVIVLAALAGCGGGQGGSCGDFAACGGDVVGNWSVQAFCGKLTDSTAACGNLTVDLDGVQASGTETFTAANVVTSDVQTSGFSTLHVPGSCLTFNGVKLTCDQVNAGFMATIGMTGTIDSIVCTTEGQGCSCKQTQTPQSTTTTGTYVITGNQLTITDSATGEISGMDYCVSGSTLRYKPPAASMVPGMGFEFQVSVVLTRQ